MRNEDSHADEIETDPIFEKFLAEAKPATADDLEQIFRDFAERLWRRDVTATHRFHEDLEGRTAAWYVALDDAYREAEGLAAA